MARSKDEHLEANDSLFDITVQTWGTQDRPSNGMMTFADQTLFGGNVGHAAINMKLPITEQIKKWIEQYCCKQSFEQFCADKNDETITFDQYLESVEKLIPVSRKRVEVRQAKYHSSGVIIPTEKSTYEQSFFEIDWSWWPGKLQTEKDDYLKEREGKEFYYAPEWKEYFQPEQRVHRGKLRERVLDYAPSVIIHQRDLPEVLLRRYQQAAHLGQIDEKLNLIERLQIKINGLNSYTVSVSTRLMFKNLALNFDEIYDRYLEQLSRGQSTTNKSDNASKNPPTEKEIEKFIKYLTSQIKKKTQELLKEKVAIEKEVKNQNVSAVLETKIDGLQKRVEFSQNKLDELAKALDPFKTEHIKPVLLSKAINAALEKVFPELEIQLEYGDISVESISAILKQVESAFNKLSRNKNKSPEDEKRLEVLKDLKNELMHYENHGVKLTKELELRLNNALKNWEELLDKPCRIIPIENVKTIRDNLSLLEKVFLGKIQFYEQNHKKLLQELNKAKIDLMKLNKFDEFYKNNKDLYVIAGVPPDHRVLLPLAVNGKRGLHPEAMLKKMHEIVAGPQKKEFNLHTNNCSLTSIEVLSAGAEHDPLLHSIMGTRALDFFGTPQQVLENAKLTSKAINGGKTSNFFTLITTARPLDRALGYAFSIYLDPEASKTKQNAGLVLGVLVGLVKIPGIIIGSLLNPKAGFNDILNTLSRVYSRNSTELKVGLTLMALLPMIVLAPLAAIQKGVEVIAETIAKPFKLIASFFEQKPQSTDEITVPVGSKKVAEKEGSYSKTALAGLVNSKIKSKIDEHTITLEFQKSPQKMIEEFELQLKENPGKVVVLTEKAHSAVLKYVSESDDEELKQKLYDCFNQSVTRSQEFAPRTRREIDELVEEVTSTDKTELNTGSRQEPLMSSSIGEEKGIDSEHQIESIIESKMRI